MPRKLEKVRSARSLQPPGEQDPRATPRREALRRAFLGLLEVKPLDQITVQDITFAANLGYVTFFRHHATRRPWHCATMSISIVRYGQRF